MPIDDKLSGLPSSPEDSPRPTETLDEIFHAIYSAVKEAHRSVQEYSMRQLMHYLVPDGEELKPKMIRVPFPRSGSPGEYVQREIPLFALLNHKDMVIDNLVVKMKVDLSSVVQEPKKGMLKKVTAGLFGRRSQMADVEITFKGADPVEGIARINDHLVRTI